MGKRETQWEIHTERIKTTPERFDTNRLDGDTLVLGAPYIGKTKLASETVDSTDADLVDAEEGNLAIAADSLVIDDFYTVYQSAGTQEQEKFEDRLTSETTTVCVFARPRAFDWLLEADDVPLADAILKQFDRVVHLRYDPEDADGDVRVASAVARELGVDEEGDGKGLDESKLHARLDELAYRYEYRNERLSSWLGSYNETLVPMLVGYISIRAGKHGVLRNGVIEAFRDLTANSSVSQFINSTKELATNLVTPEAVGMVSASVAGPAFAAAVSLGMWGYFREGSVTGDDGGTGARSEMSDAELVDSLGILTGDDLTPTAQAELEDRLDLPPRTLDHLTALFEGDSLRRVRELYENAPEQMDEFEARLKTNESELTQLSQTVENLETRIESLTDFYSEQLANAAQTLETVGDQLERDEAALLRPLIDAEEVNAEATPWVDPQEPIDDGDIGGDSTIAGVEDTPPPTIQEIIDGASSGRLVVLTGAHGTGKTTAAYRACCHLKKGGFTIRMPGLQNQSPEFVRSRLERDKKGDNLVLFASFGRLFAGERVTWDDLATLFRWLNEGVCHTVIVECRSELFSSFREGANDAGSGLEGTNPWTSRETIALQRFDDSRRLLTIINWVAKMVGGTDTIPDDEDELSDLLREILDMSRGNSEIAKIAAKFAFADEFSLDEITTDDDLVEQDIETLFGQTRGDRSDQWALLRYLAVAGELRTEHLRELPDITRGDLEPLAVQLRDYLGREIAAALDDGDLEGVRWRLEPDVYADVTFRRCLRGGDLPNQRSEFKRVFDQVADLDHASGDYDYRQTVADSLSIAYDDARTKGDDQLRQWTVEASDWFLDEIVTDTEPEAFLLYLRSLTIRGVPVDVAPLRNEQEKFFTGAKTEAKALGVQQGAVLQGVVGSILAARLADDRSIEQVTQLADDLAVTVQQKDVYTTEAFIKEFFSTAFARLAVYHLPEEAEVWVEKVADLARDAAINGPHDQSPTPFLSGVYSRAFEKLLAFSQIETGPSPQGTKHWIETLADRVTHSASEGLHEDPGLFLINVYSMALSGHHGLMDMFNAEDVDVWIETFADLAVNAATEGPHEDRPDSFLQNVYSMALSKLGKSHEPAEVDIWIERLSTRILTAAEKETHDTSPELFLSNVYSMAVALLARDRSPEEVGAWLETCVTNAATAATEGPHDRSSGSILVNTYGNILWNLTESYSLEEADAWVESLTDSLPAVATRNELSVSPAAFTAEVTTVAVVRTSARPSDQRISDWHRLFIRHAADSLNHDELEEFYDEFQLEYYSSCLHFETAPTGLAVLVEDVLDRTVQSDDQEPVHLSEEEQIDLVASVASSVVFTLGTLIGEKLDDEISDNILRDLGSVGSDDPGVFAATIATVEERLVSGHVPDWPQEFAAEDEAITGYRLSDRLVGRTYATAISAIESTEETDRTPESIIEAAHFNSQVDDEDGSRQQTGSDATTRLYRAGLRAVLDNHGGVAKRLFQGIWTARGEEYEDSGDETPSTILSAGIGYRAYLELTYEPAIRKREKILSFIETNRDRLSVQTQALVELLADGEPTGDAEAIATEVDIDEDQHGDIGTDADIAPRALSELEKLAHAQLISKLIDSRDSSDVTGYYHTALVKITNAEPDDAFPALEQAWTLREGLAPESDAYADALAAGVVLLAHMNFGYDSEIDGEEIIETVADHRDRLSRPVEALYELLSGGASEAESETCRERIEADSDDADWDDVEAISIATLIDVLTDNSPKDGSLDGNSSTISSGSDRTESATHEQEQDDIEGGEPQTDAFPSELLDYYRDGLTHVVEGNYQLAISPLINAWDFLDQVRNGERGRQLAFSAGIALAVLVVDDPGLSLLREEVLNVIEETEAREELSASARPVLSAMTVGNSDVTPDELLEKTGAEVDVGGPEGACDLDELEARAFARLLDRELK